VVLQLQQLLQQDVCGVWVWVGVCVRGSVCAWEMGGEGGAWVTVWHNAVGQGVELVPDGTTVVAGGGTGGAATGGAVSTRAARSAAAAGAAATICSAGSAARSAVAAGAAATVGSAGSAAGSAAGVLGWSQWPCEPHAP
jgi:hypothetical protein